LIIVNYICSKNYGYLVFVYQLKLMSCFTGKCGMGTQEQSSWEDAWMWTWCTCCYAVGIC